MQPPTAALDIGKLYAASAAAKKRVRETDSDVPHSHAAIVPSCDLMSLVCDMKLCFDRVVEAMLHQSTVALDNGDAVITSPHSACLEAFEQSIAALQDAIRSKIAIAVKLDLLKRLDDDIASKKQMFATMTAALAIAKGIA